MKNNELTKKELQKNFPYEIVVEDGYHYNGQGIRDDLIDSMRLGSCIEPVLLGEHGDTKWVLIVQETPIVIEIVEQEEEENDPGPWLERFWRAYKLEEILPEQLEFQEDHHE